MGYGWEPEKPEQYWKVRRLGLGTQMPDSADSDWVHQKKNETQAKERHGTGTRMGQQRSQASENVQKNPFLLGYVPLHS